MAVYRCCHVKLNGARCTMPALNDKDFCFTHETRILRARSKPCSPPTTNWMTAPLFSLRYPEDHRDVIENEHSALDSFARHQIDFRQLAVVGRQMDIILKSLAGAERREAKLKALKQEVIVSEARIQEDGSATAYPDLKLDWRPQVATESAATLQSTIIPIPQMQSAPTPESTPEAITEPAPAPLAELAPVGPEPPDPAAIESERPAVDGIIPTITACADTMNGREQV